MLALARISWLHACSRSAGIAGDSHTSPHPLSSTQEAKGYVEALYHVEVQWPATKVYCYVVVVCMQSHYCPRRPPLYLARQKHQQLNFITVVGVSDGMPNTVGLTTDGTTNSKVWAIFVRGWSGDAMHPPSLLTHSLCCIKCLPSGPQRVQ